MASAPAASRDSAPSIAGCSSTDAPRPVLRSGSLEPLEEVGGGLRLEMGGLAAGPPSPPSLSCYAFLLARQAVAVGLLVCRIVHTARDAAGAGDTGRGRRAGRRQARRRRARDAARRRRAARRR